MKLKEQMFHFLQEVYKEGRLKLYFGLFEAWLKEVLYRKRWRIPHLPMYGRFKLKTLLVSLCRNYFLFYAFKAPPWLKGKSLAYEAWFGTLPKVLGLFQNIFEQDLTKHVGM